MADITTAALDAAHQQLRSARTFAAVCAGVAVWEHVCTLRQEYVHIWRRSFSHVGIAWLVQRYGLLAEMFLIVYLSYWPGRSSAACGRRFLSYPLVSVVVYLAGQYIMVARLFAVFEKAIWPIVAPIVIMLGSAVLQIYDLTLLRSLQLPAEDSACLPDASTSHLKLYPYIYGLLMAFDLVVSVLTLVKSATSYRRIGNKASPASFLLAILLGDQVVTFVAVAAVAVANLIFYFTAEAVVPTFLSPLVALLQAMLIGRAVLNLRAASQEQVSSVSIKVSHHIPSTSYVAEPTTPQIAPMGRSPLLKVPQLPGFIPPEAYDVRLEDGYELKDRNSLV